MAIHSCVLESALGNNPEGSVLQLDEETVNALISAGLAREATMEDLGDKEVAPEDNVEEEDDETPEQVEASVNRITRNAEAAVKKATEAVANEYVKSISKNVKRPITVPSNRHVTGSDEWRTGGFKSMGEVFQTALQAESGCRTSAKKIGKVHDMLGARAKATGMSISGSGGLVGGTLVPQEWASELWRLAFKDVPNLLEMCQRYEMRNQIENIPSFVQATAISGVTGAITAETTSSVTGTIAPSVQPTGNVQLALTKEAFLVNFSDEVLRFNSYNLEANIKQVVPERLNYYTNDAIINGNSGTNLNLVGNPATVYVGRQAANRINPRDIYSMRAALFNSFRSGACWLVNPSTTPELYMMGFPNSAASTQTPVFLPGSFGQGLVGTPLGMMAGFPVYEIENCPALGTTGDLILWHGGSCAYGSTGLIADETPYLYFNIAQNSFRFMYYYSSVNPLTVPYTRKDNSYASNIVVLNASSLSSI